MVEQVGARILVNAFQEAGIKVIFTLSGNHIMMFQGFSPNLDQQKCQSGKRLASLDKHALSLAD